MPLPTGIETPAKGPSVSYAQQVAEAKVIEQIATYYQMVIVAQLTPSV